MDQTPPALIKKGVTRLTNCELPQLEAMILLEKASNIKKEKLFAMRTEKVSKKVCKKYFKLIKKRSKGIPSAYILKEKEFFGRVLKVTPAVLIPRPDTEILVEEALQIIEKENINSVWDLCTGSGAVIISIGCETNKNIELFASDLSKAALKIAKLNCQCYLQKVKLFQGNLLEALPSQMKTDMIVTNPPYLTNLECNRKIAEGWKEPDLALRAGEDGLDLIKTIIKDSLDRLNPNGYLLIEASSVQMDQIEKLLNESHYTQIKKIKDLGGRERVISGKLSLQA